MTSITLPRSKTPYGIAFSHIGEGVPVLFIHGVGLRLESWYQQISAIRADYSVYAIDMPGHGSSDLLPSKIPTLYDFTEKLAQFIIEEIKQPAIIVGHSMGGLLALSLSREYPELCLAVVPMNTIYKRSIEAKIAVKSRASNLKNLSQADACAPIARWFSDTPTAKDKLHEKLCREWLTAANLEGYAAAYKVFSEEDGPRTAAIGNLRIPVLYMTGELDLNSNVSMTNTMARITPNAEALIIKDSRHMTPLTHASEVNEALLSFFKRRLNKSETDLSHLQI